MSDAIEIQVDGLQELVYALEALGRNPEAELVPAMEKAMYFIWQNIPPYPPPPQPGTASRFWTKKQRGWFFANLREGKITVPYRRRLSAGLGGSISTKTQSQTGQVTGVIGSSMSYAKWVVSRDDQARIHQGRWWIFEDEVEKSIPGAIRILERGVVQILSTL